MKNKQTNVGSFATAKLQAKRRSLLAIALVAVIAFSFTACNKGSGGGGGGAGKLIVTGLLGGGKLTITGLPSGNYSVGVYAAGTDVSSIGAIGKADPVAGMVVGANGVTMLVDRKSTENNPLFWTGSGSHTVVLFLASKTAVWRTTVNFSNGSATVPWSSFRRID